MKRGCMTIKGKNILWYSDFLSFTTVFRYLMLFPPCSKNAWLVVIKNEHVLGMFSCLLRKCESWKVLEGGDRNRKL